MRKSSSSGYRRGRLRHLGLKLRRVREYLTATRWRIERTVPEADRIPELIPHHRAILVGTPSLQKWLVFDCPCNSDHRIMLNLDINKTPYWRLKVSLFGRITVSPSVHYLGGGGTCHYFLTRGRVIWTRDATLFEARTPCKESIHGRHSR